MGKKKSFSGQPFLEKLPFQKISLILPVFNEAIHLEAKLNNLLELDCQGLELEVIVVLDGCTDGSTKIMNRWRDYAQVRMLSLPRRNGKPAAINQGVRSASGDILIFCDASQKISSDALHYLLRNFHDLQTGLVSGCLEHHGFSIGGKNAFRKYSNWLKRKESQAGWIAGAYGPLYAIRRELFRPLPEDFILDDMVLPVTVAEQGYRSMFEPRAKVFDRRQFSGAGQFRRGSRIMRGLIQFTPYVMRARIPSTFKMMYFFNKILRFLLMLIGCFFCFSIFTSQEDIALWLTFGVLLGFMFVASIRFWVIQFLAASISLLAWPFLKADVLWRK